MIIDRECVMNILSTIEEKSTYKCPCRMIAVSDKYPALKDYESDKLHYHLRYLLMKELVYHPNRDDDLGYDLTPSGHEFLNSARK